MSDQGVEVLPPIRVDETDAAIKESTDVLEHYDMTDQGDKDSPPTRVDRTDESAAGRMKQDTIQGRTNPANDRVEIWDKMVGPVQIKHPLTP